MNSSIRSLLGLSLALTTQAALAQTKPDFAIQLPLASIGDRLGWSFQEDYRLAVDEGALVRLDVLSAAINLSDYPKDRKITSSYLGDETYSKDALHSVFALFQQDGRPIVERTYSSSKTHESDTLLAARLPAGTYPLLVRTLGSGKNAFGLQLTGARLEASRFVVNLLNKPQVVTLATFNIPASLVGHQVNLRNYDGDSELDLWLEDSQGHVTALKGSGDKAWADNTLPVEGGNTGRWVLKGKAHAGSQQFSNSVALEFLLDGKPFYADLPGKSQETGTLQYLPVASYCGIEQPLSGLNAKVGMQFTPPGSTALAAGSYTLFPTQVQGLTPQQVATPFVVRSGSTTRVPVVYQADSQLTLTPSRVQLGVGEETELTVELTTPFQGSLSGGFEVQLPEGLTALGPLVHMGTFTQGQPLKYTLRVRADQEIATGQVKAVLLSQCGAGEASASVQTTAETDVSLSMFSDHQQVQDGQEVTFTLQATNQGQATAMRPTISQSFPAGVEFLSAQGPGVEHWDGSQLTYTLPDLKPGERVVLQVRTRIQDLRNAVDVKARVLTSAPDVQPQNNSSAVTVSALYGFVEVNATAEACGVMVPLSPLLRREERPAGEFHFLPDVLPGSDSKAVTTTIKPNATTAVGVVYHVQEDLKVQADRTVLQVGEVAMLTAEVTTQFPAAVPASVQFQLPEGLEPLGPITMQGQVSANAPFRVQLAVQATRPAQTQQVSVILNSHCKAANQHLQVLPEPTTGEIASPIRPTPEAVQETVPQRTAVLSELFALPTEKVNQVVPAAEPTTTAPLWASKIAEDGLPVPPLDRSQQPTEVSAQDASPKGLLTDSPPETQDAPPGSPPETQDAPPGSPEKPNPPLVVVKAPQQHQFRVLALQGLTGMATVVAEGKDVDVQALVLFGNTPEEALSDQNEPESITGRREGNFVYWTFPVKGAFLTLRGKGFSENALSVLGAHTPGSARYTITDLPEGYQNSTHLSGLELYTGSPVALQWYVNTLWAQEQGGASHQVAAGLFLQNATGLPVVAFTARDSEGRLGGDATLQVYLRTVGRNPTTLDVQSVDLLHGKGIMTLKLPAPDRPKTLHLQLVWKQDGAEQVIATYSVVDQHNEQVVPQRLERVLSDGSTQVTLDVQGSSAPQQGTHQADLKGVVSTEVLGGAFTAALAVNLQGTQLEGQVSPATAQEPFPAHQVSPLGTPLLSADQVLLNYQNENLEVGYGLQGQNFTGMLAGSDQNQQGLHAELHFGGFGVKAFAGLTGSASSSVEFRVDGTSMYHVPQLRGVQDTQEVVRVITRDALNPGLILSVRTLKRYADYHIDPETGLLTLRGALPAFDDRGNPLSLSVEFSAEAQADAGSYGVQASWQAGSFDFTGTVLDTHGSHGAAFGGAVEAGFGPFKAHLEALQSEKLGLAGSLQYNTSGFQAGVVASRKDAGYFDPNTHLLTEHATTELRVRVQNTFTANITVQGDFEWHQQDTVGESQNLMLGTIYDMGALKLRAGTVFSLSKSPDFSQKSAFVTSGADLTLGNVTYTVDHRQSIFSNPSEVWQGFWKLTTCLQEIYHAKR